MMPFFKKLAYQAFGKMLGYGCGSGLAMLLAVGVDCNVVHTQAICSLHGDFLFHSPDGNT